MDELLTDEEEDAKDNRGQHASADEKTALFAPPPLASSKKTTIVANPPGFMRPAISGPTQQAPSSTGRGGEKPPPPIQFSRPTEQQGAAAIQAYELGRNAAVANSSNPITKKRPSAADVQVIDLVDDDDSVVGDDGDDMAKKGLISQNSLQLDYLDNLEKELAKRERAKKAKKDARLRRENRDEGGKKRRKLSLEERVDANAGSRAEKRQLEQKVRQLASASVLVPLAAAGNSSRDRGRPSGKAAAAAASSSSGGHQKTLLRHGGEGGNVTSASASTGVTAAAAAAATGSSTAAAAPSFAPSKSDQRLATERLFHPASHQNAAMMMALWEELGLDSSDVNSAEAMLKIMKISHPSYLQRLAACLKIGPQMLFKQAFLS